MAGKVTLTVNNADNELAAFVNGITVYNRITAGNPPLTDVVDLTPALEAGNNILVIIGINFDGPATFKGSLTIGPSPSGTTSFVIPFFATFPTTTPPQGIVWTQVFNIPF
jgi:hypothetical protein